MYRVDRPGQVRGVPWSAPVMLRLQNFDDVEDAYIEREKIASCFTVWITDNEVNPGPEGSTKRIELMDRLEPGAVNVGPPDSTITFANPPGVNGYESFAWENKHAMAAGLQVPYEVFGDLSGVNFASGRMGWQNYGRRIECWQWSMVIPDMCERLAGWMVDAALITGDLTEGLVSVGWVPPRRIMVNPKEEIEALKQMVRNGFETWGDIIRSLGYDPMTQAEQIEFFNELLDKHKLKLDCDPRFALPAGSAGATDPANPNNPQDGPADPPKKPKKSE